MIKIKDDSIIQFNEEEREAIRACAKVFWDLHKLCTENVETNEVWTLPNDDITVLAELQNAVLAVKDEIIIYSSN